MSKPVVVESQAVVVESQPAEPVMAAVVSSADESVPVTSEATMVVEPVQMNNSEPMMVTCPPNGVAGQPMEVINPKTGTGMQVVVPNGISPGDQFQVVFPSTPVVPQQAQQLPPQQVQAAFVQQQPDANTRQCRGCGRPFQLEPGQNPAAASAFRCKKCRGLSGIRFW